MASQDRAKSGQTTIIPFNKPNQTWPAPEFSDCVALRIQHREIMRAVVSQ
jgi:hypothetical protein